MPTLICVPYDQTGPNSGTGFARCSDDTLAQKRAFNYLILGIQEHNNNLFLFDFVANQAISSDWSGYLPMELQGSL